MAFAAACMLKPKLLVLDEPTSNLDSKAIDQLHDMISVMKQAGVTVVLAEHRLAWMSDLADRYLFFEKGILRADWGAGQFAALSEESLAVYGLRARNLTRYREKLQTKKRLRCDTDPVLELRNLTIGYQKKNPVRTLPDMSFAAGEIVGLMGHNGAGKSTLAKTLCGLLEPISGRMLWNGKKANAKTRLHKSFLVMQDVNYQLFGDSVLEEIQLGAAHPEKSSAVMEALGLDKFADRHPMSLSGGQKQRVVVAAAGKMPMFQGGAKKFWQKVCVTVTPENPHVLGGWNITAACEDAESAAAAQEDSNASAKAAGDASAALCIEWLAEDGMSLGSGIYHLDSILEKGLEGKENLLFVAENAAPDWAFRCLLAMEPMPKCGSYQNGGLLSHLHFQYAAQPEALFDPETKKLRNPMWYATMCEDAGTVLEQCNIVRALHRLPVWEKLPEK